MNAHHLQIHCNTCGIKIIRDHVFLYNYALETFESACSVKFIEGNIRKGLSQPV